MRRLAPAGVLVLALALAAPAAQAESVDIPSAAHMTIVGGPNLGRDVAGVGDVNGDGVPDVAVMDRLNAAYVVFGRRTPTTVDVSSLGSRGFRIAGAVEGVARAGDVNGDGLADVLVTQPYEDFAGRDQAGAAYVIFGKATTGGVDLASLGSAGFRIGGPIARGQAINEVAVDGAGDVNGDGRADVIVGFAQTRCTSFILVCEDLAGSAYVVYGKTSSTAVDTAALGPGGFSITGDVAGATVAGLGDFNGDGIPDVAVSRHYDNAGWVVFGRRPAANVDLANLGTGGFKIVDTTSERIDPSVPSSEVQDWSVAYSLAGADVNGDRRPDLIVGSGPRVTNYNPQWPERAAVIFGGASTAPVDIASLGSRGFKIVGGTRLSFAAAGGDNSGDGLADVLVHGLKAPPYGGGVDRGVLDVFGKASTTTVDVNNLGSQGVALTGAFKDFGVPRSFDGAGDVTGDGLADVIVGVPWWSDDSTETGPGRAYVVSLKPTALRRLDELRFHIASFGLPDRLRDRFFGKLDRIRFVYVFGNQPSACRRLDRLIGLAQRLNGNRLTGAQAFTIVAGAGQAKNAAGCG